ncbi:Hsp70 family protein [Aeromicrobium sp. A1-2]|uniref:Hsp70 family protein n=1 Tax=Aeromicrobium sp. A1-2 TaxID=2107713 RepID=UPI0013C36C00|nr:Hsp70 family protein [Aeromicrobium sp. A1-2]
MFRDESGQITRAHAHDLYAAEVVRIMRLADAHPGQTHGRGVVVATPCWWTTRATEATSAAIRASAGRKVVLVKDAEAAVRGHLIDEPRLADMVAVLDLGAQTTSAAVVHHTRSIKPTVIGRPAVQINDAGDELDAKVLHHLLHGLGDRRVPIDSSDPVVTAAADELLEQCREAKHSLSARSAATIDTRITGQESRLRLVRGEFEEIALEWARTAVRILGDAIEASGQEVRSVLLVGGGAHIPLIAQSISAGLGLNVIASRHPTETTATGARQAAAGIDHRVSTPRGARQRIAASTAVENVADALPVHPVSAPETPSARRPRRRRFRNLNVKTHDIATVANEPIESTVERWSLADWADSTDVVEPSSEVEVEPDSEVEVEPDSEVETLVEVEAVEAVAAPARDLSTQGTRSATAAEPGDTAAQIPHWPADVDEVHSWVSPPKRPGFARRGRSRARRAAEVPSVPDSALHEPESPASDGAIFPGAPPTTDDGLPTGSESVEEIPEDSPKPGRRRRSRHTTGLLLVLLVGSAQLTWADRPSAAEASDPSSHSSSLESEKRAGLEQEARGRPAPSLAESSGSPSLPNANVGPARTPVIAPAAPSPAAPVKDTAPAPTPSTSPTPSPTAVPPAADSEEGSDEPGTPDADPVPGQE